MKLNKLQIQQIEAFLDRKSLKYIDLRYEVLDHIALGIEKQMENDSIDFSSAFTLETAKWNKELAEDASWWIGLVWSGPKIMIEKCVKIVKTFYLFLIPITTVLFLFFWLIFYTNNQLLSYSKEIETFIGVYYLICAALILFFRFKIKASNYTTSYSFFFRTQAFFTCLLYVCYNPFWTSIIGFIQNDDIILISLFSNCLFIVYPYIFWLLFKSHFNEKKVSLNLV